MADAKINILLSVKDDGTATIVSVSKEMQQMAAVSREASNAMKLAFAGLGAFVSSQVAAAFVTATRNAMEYSDTLEEMASVVGVTTDELQEIRFAAKGIGVDTEKTDSALKRFSLNIGEAAEGGGKLYDVIKQYGIELRDSSGNLRSNTDLLHDFAYYIKNAKDEQEKLRIATHMFGKDGGAMVNLLRDGAGAFDAARQSAHDYGAVLDKEAIAKAGKLNDEFDRMMDVVKVQLSETFLNVAPLIVDLTKNFAELTKGLNQFVSAAKEAGSSAYESFGNWWNTYMPDSFEGFATKAQTDIGPPASLKPGPAPEKEDKPAKHKKTYEELREQYKQLAADGIKAAQGVTDFWQLQMQEHYEVMSRTSQAFLDRDKALAEEGIRLSQGVTSFWEIQNGEVYDVVSRGAQAMVDANKERMDELSAEGIKAAQGVKDAWEFKAEDQPSVDQRGLDAINTRYMDERELLRAHYEEQFVMAEDYYSALAALGNQWVLDNQEMVQQVALDTMSLMQQTLDQFSAAVAASIVEGKSLGDAMKAVWKMLAKAIIQEIINMTVKYIALSIARTTATEVEATTVVAANATQAVSESGKQSASMGPWGMAGMMALTLALFVAAIAATKGAFGSAHGGLDFVPDEQTYRLQRGERVLSPRQNRDVTEAVMRINAGMTGGGQTIVVQSVLDGRVVAESVTRAAANGYAQWGNRRMAMESA